MIRKVIQNPSTIPFKYVDGTNDQDFMKHSRRTEDEYMEYTIEELFTRLSYDDAPHIIVLFLDCFATHQEKVKWTRGTKILEFFSEIMAEYHKDIWI